MATDMTVANTILAQLGGNRFMMMTGAKNLIGSEKSLSFRIPKAKGGINAVVVKLEPSDTYTVEFKSLKKLMSKPEIKVVKKIEGIYADQLQEIFTNETGLYTKL